MSHLIVNDVKKKSKKSKKCIILLLLSWYEAHKHWCNPIILANFFMHIGHWGARHQIVTIFGIHAVEQTVQFKMASCIELVFIRDLFPFLFQYTYPIFYDFLLEFKNVKGWNQHIFRNDVFLFLLSKSGPSQGLKIRGRGTSCTVLGIICPLGRDRINCSAQTWGAPAWPAPSLSLLVLTLFK